MQTRENAEKDARSKQQKIDAMLEAFRAILTDRLEIIKDEYGVMFKLLEDPIDTKALELAYYQFGFKNLNSDAPTLPAHIRGILEYYTGLVERFELLLKLCNKYQNMQNQEKRQVILDKIRDLVHFTLAEQTEKSRYGEFKLLKKLSDLLTPYISATQKHVEELSALPEAKIHFGNDVIGKMDDFMQRLVQKICKINNYSNKASASAAYEKFDEKYAKSTGDILERDLNLRKNWDKNLVSGKHILIGTFEEILDIRRMYGVLYLEMGQLSKSVDRTLEAEKQMQSAAPAKNPTPPKPSAPALETSKNSAVTTGPEDIHTKELRRAEEEARRIKLEENEQIARAQGLIRAEEEARLRELARAEQVAREAREKQKQEEIARLNFERAADKQEQKTAGKQAADSFAPSPESALSSDEDDGEGEEFKEMFQPCAAKITTAGERLKNLNQREIDKLQMLYATTSAQMNLSKDYTAGELAKLAIALGARKTKLSGHGYFFFDTTKKDGTPSTAVASFATEHGGAHSAGELKGIYVRHFRTVLQESLGITPGILETFIKKQEQKQKQKASTRPPST